MQIAGRWRERLVHRQTRVADRHAAKRVPEWQTLPRRVPPDLHSESSEVRACCENASSRETVLRRPLPLMCSFLHFSRIGCRQSPQPCERLILTRQGIGSGGTRRHQGRRSTRVAYPVQKPSGVASKAYWWTEHWCGVCLFGNGPVWCRRLLLRQCTRGSVCLFRNRPVYGRRSG